MSSFSFSKIFLTISLFCLFLGGASAQQSKGQRGAPKTSETNPSKSDSAKFLEEKIK